MFEQDPYPGKPKILFIALGGSSHTHAWLDLLKDAEFNIRLFSMPGMPDPPVDWMVRTYSTNPDLPQGLDVKVRKTFYPFPEEIEKMKNRLDLKILAAIIRIMLMGLRWFGILIKDQNIIISKIIDMIIINLTRKNFTPNSWLASIINEWQPDIIHTLGLFDNQGGEYYYRVRKTYGLEGIGKWLVTLRGGSDLTLNRHDPAKVPLIREMLLACDEIISDNVVNIEYAAEMGIPREKFASITPVPGTGGIDVEGIMKRWDKLPSQRDRIILWTKAYDCEWSVALPVFEALQLCWEQIQPCKMYMLQMHTIGTQAWYNALPSNIRSNCIVNNYLSRDELLILMTKARVVLATSLIDGIPNVLYEAMACGAVPIVSPLATISMVVKNEENVIFARNLYHQEIADAIELAMNNDILVDSIVKNNLKKVYQLANRHVIKEKVIKQYENLVHC